MKKVTHEMVEILEELRDKHHAIGLKLSFEDEGTLDDEVKIFMGMAKEVNLPVSLKIGGCEAKKDMHDAVVLGASKIVGPMIESPYALKKFVQAMKSVLTEQQRAGLKFFINVETITAYQSFSAMLATPEAKDIHGVVLGRVDLVGSMGLTRAEVNSEEIFNIAYDMSVQLQKAGLRLYVGGAVTTGTMDFLRRLPKGVLGAFETRNVIFDADAEMSNSAIETALAKALKFELMWMKYKMDMYTFLAQRDVQRIDMLDKRVKEILGN